MFSHPANSTGTARPWRLAVAHGVLALGLTVSNVADACSLDALLRLPLECLLELHIGAQRDSKGAGAQPPCGRPNCRAAHAA